MASHKISSWNSTLVLVTFLILKIMVRIQETIQIIAKSIDSGIKLPGFNPSYATCEPRDPRKIN